MAKKTCGHEDVCRQCTEAAIAKLQKKIDALKKTLPEPTVIIREVEVEKKWPGLVPRWPNENMLLCVGSEYVGNEQYGNHLNKG